MKTLIECARRWREERRQYWLERGLAEGREQGVEDGVEQGRVEGKRDLVRGLVAHQFGPEAADEVRPILNALSDSELIEAAIALAVIQRRAAEEFKDRVTRITAT